MNIRQRLFLCVVLSAGFVAMAWPHAQQGGAQRAPTRMYNTARAKLMSGRPIVGGTVFSPDPNIYCAMANSGFDFTWIEMQHSPLTYSDVARMLYACRGAAAMPFIRVPDATEGEIQKATDIGALGIIVPTVDTVEKAEAAVRWTRYPPVGRRSQGGNQAGAIWGDDYRQTFNDNVIVMVMIETPIGAAIADKIAAVPGVDVVFAASNDMSNFSGYQQGDPRYEALITRIRDATLAAGKKLGGPQAWMDRPGYSFFQGPGEAVLLRQAGQANMKANPPQGGGR